jgi:DNA-binding LacI/PurR family transcriptional regulator
LAAQTTPPLTTVALPCYEIGSMAMNLLLEIINTPEESRQDEENRHRLVKTSLVIRQSTAEATRQ